MHHKFGTQYSKTKHLIKSAYLLKMHMPRVFFLVKSPISPRVRFACYFLFTIDI